MSTPRVVMIGLDAAEPSLIEQWIADGTLPHLKRLRERGAYGRLASTADWLAGSVWPTFYTGAWPADHGIFHHLQWRADQMHHARPTADWLPARPFWRALSQAGPRVVAIDLPMVYAPEPMNGVEISGWATHDRLVPPSSSPPELMRAVEQEFGPPHLKKEGSSHRKPAALLRLRDELVKATEDLTAMGRAMMQRQPWDLWLCGFGAPHRGGHMLWGLPESHGEMPEPYHGPLRHALRDVYAACDAAVGELTAAAGDGATVLVFSLHGMGANTSRAELVLPKMLARVLAGPRAPKKVKEQGSPLESVRRMIPIEWRSAVRRRLPLGVQDKLTAFWRTGKIDWTVTKALCQVADAQGYLRVNLRGRESAGIVQPGQEFEALCSQIEAGLKTFADADTGEPVVSDVLRTDRIFPEGAHRDKLPDLLVRWAKSPARMHRSLVSPAFGSVQWPTPGSTPDHRSGNHQGEGFLIASGGTYRPGSTIQGAHILDLAPTVYALFGVPTPSTMRGHPRTE
jgi:predicted AlkP superfamily phosphohydrolase/phosphomutase